MSGLWSPRIRVRSSKDLISEWMSSIKLSWLVDSVLTHVAAIFPSFGSVTASHSANGKQHHYSKVSLCSSESRVGDLAIIYVIRELQSSSIHHLQLCLELGLRRVRTELHLHGCRASLTGPRWHTGVRVRGGGCCSPTRLPAWRFWNVCAGFDPVQAQVVVH